MIVIPEALPKARFVLRCQREAAEPLGALPEVEMRDEEPYWAAMLELERLAVIRIDHPRRAAGDIFAVRFVV